MKKVFEDILESHRLKRVAYSKMVPQEMIICVQDHYDVPRVSASYMNAPSHDSAMFDLMPDGDLVRVDGDRFTGDILVARRQIKLAIGSVI